MKQSLVLLLGAWLLAGQLPAADDAAATLNTVDPKYSVEGKVLDSKGAPIAGAEIIIGERQCGCPQLQPAATGADGKFAVKDIPKDALYQWRGPTLLITITAKGFATTLLELPAKQETKDIEVRLAPGNKIRGKVVDTDGKPIQGAFVAAGRWRGYDVLAWRVDTGADGTFEWDEAPADAVDFDFGKEGFRYVRDVSLTPSDEELFVELQKPIAVSGHVFDAKTKKPLTDFVVTEGAKWPKYEVSYGKRVPHKDPQGHFALGIDEPAHMHHGTGENGFTPGVHLVRVEVPGYLSVVSRPITDKENSADLEFAMEPAENLKLVILAPNGKPAPGATLVVGGVGNGIMVTDGKLSYNEDKVKLTSDASGKISIPPQPGNPIVVIAGDAGVWQGRLDDLKKSQKPRLSAWVSVRVETTTDVKPGEKCPFYVNFHALDDLYFKNQKQEDTYFRNEGRIEKPGLVIFDHLPPGLVRVGTSMQPDNQATELTLKPGGTATIQRDKEVVALGGKIDFPVEGVAWELQQAQLQFKQPLPKIPPDLTLQERQDWYDSWIKTDEGKAWRKGQERVYVQRLKSNGSFFFEKVAPGTYTLQIPVRRGSALNTGDNVLAGLISREIQIPTRNEMEKHLLKANPDIASADGAGFSIFVKDFAKNFQRCLQPGDDLPSLQVHPLDGGEIDIAKTGSEYTLVIFWSSLLDPSHTFLDSINQLASEYPAEKLKIIGISYDESRTMLDRFLAKNPSKWTQCFLGEKALPDLLQKFGPIDYAPVICLTGKDGKILTLPGRDTCRQEVEKMVNK